MSNDKKNLVVQSNLLIERKQKFSLIEAKLFAKTICSINKDDNIENGYLFNIAQLLSDFGMHHKDYKKIINTAKALRKKTPTLNNINGKEIDTGYFLKSIHDTYKGTILICLCSELKPYLLALKQNFTIYQLENILKINGTHSIRLYELLKQFEKLQQRMESLENLKYLLGVEDKYFKYNHFKERILLPSQAELKEKTDISFDFEEIKTGRAITHIKFIIHKQSPQLTAGASQPAEVRPVDPPANPIINRLTSLGFNEKQAQEIAKRETPEFITANADILEELQRQGRINTNIPAFSKGFTKDFRQAKSAHEIEQEARQEQAKAEAERIAKAKAEQAKADDLGKTIYNKSLEIYTEIFFSNTEQNSEFIKDFENRYIKTGVGATLFKNRPETAKTAFIQTNKQIDINTEVIKIAESDGYLLTFDGEQWQAIEDNQEKLFPID